MNDAIAAYVRCSTNEQAVSGLGLEAQRIQITAYAAALAPTSSVTWFEDHASGRTTCGRPQLKFLLDARTSYRHLIVSRLDRLGRNTLDLLSIVRALDVAGVKFHSVNERIDTSGPLGTLFLTMLAAMAQFERDLVAERTSLALQAKRAAGGLVGRPPFGYKGDPPHPDPDTFNKVVAILAMRNAGASLRAIAARLDLKLSTVRYVAQNPWYLSEGGLSPCH